MIARALALALLLVLAGCAGPRATAPMSSASAAWLVGAWLAELPDGDRFPDACASDAPIAYRADGRYVTYGEVGRWRLAGDRLILVMEEADVDPADRARIGQETVSRIERIDAGRMMLDRDGDRTLFRRCP